MFVQTDRSTLAPDKREMGDESIGVSMTIFYGGQNIKYIYLSLKLKFVVGVLLTLSII